MKGRAEKINYKEIVFKVVVATAVLSVALMAPNALQMFSHLKKREKIITTYKIKSKTQKMIKLGFLVMTRDGVALTKKGRLEYLKYIDLKKTKPKNWNGKWFVVIFDFPNKQNRLREIIRFHLKRIGFYQLQKSVWVFPYKCDEFITYLKTELGIGNQVHFLHSNSISDDQNLKNIFNLKRVK